MPKIFSSFLSGFNVNSKKKKVITPMEASFSPILCWSPKKKIGPSSEFCNFSPRFLRHTRARRREPRLSTVFGGKQKRRFLAGEKTPEFAKFQCENAGKNFALFALFCTYREHWWLPNCIHCNNEKYQTLIQLKITLYTKKTSTAHCSTWYRYNT